MTRAQFYNKPINYFTTPFFIYLTIFIIYVSLLVIKVHGFLVTGNLLLLGEGFTSFFGILAVIFFIIGRNLRHQKILIEITQALFLITGIFFLMLCSFRVFDKQFTKWYLCGQN